MIEHYLGELDADDFALFDLQADRLEGDEAPEAADH
jgi:hypothetical protein